MASGTADEHFAKITGLHLSRLLPLGFAESTAPIEELVRRLEMPDGAAWLEGVLAPAAWGARAPLEELLVRGSGTLEEMRALKTRANDVMKRSASLDDVLRGMAVYFLAVAAALAHHGELISSQRKQEVEAALLRLAPAFPRPWTELLARRP